MSVIHVMHAMRMEMPREEQDEGDEAFTEVTKEYFEFERKVARRQYTGKVVQELETSRSMAVPRSFLRLCSGLQQALSFEHFTRGLCTFPDTLAVTFERGYYDASAKEWHVDPSTFRCPLALQFSELGDTKHYALVGALMASTDKSPHRAYLRVNSDLAQDWLSATHGDQLLASSECAPVSTARVRHALDGYAVGDGAVHEYPIRLWYRDVEIMRRRDPAFERNQICHATNERIKEKRREREIEAWKVQEAAAQALIDEEDRERARAAAGGDGWSMERRAAMREAERAAQKRRDELKLDKKARKALNAARRAEERKERESASARSTNRPPSGAPRPPRVRLRLRPRPAERRARLAKLQRAKAKVAFRVWDVVTGLGSRAGQARARGAEAARPRSWRPSASSPSRRSLPTPKSAASRDSNAKRRRWRNGRAYQRPS